jgi:hypothetical protein
MLDNQTSPIVECHPAVPGNPAATAGEKVRLAGGRAAAIAEPVPGKRVAVVEPEAIPKHGMIKMMRQQDGRYLPVLTSWSRMIQLSPQTPRELGMPDLHFRSLRRLVQCGLVRGVQPSPSVYLMDLKSFWDHLEATREPGYWTAERRETYRTTF